MTDKLAVLRAQTQRYLTTHEAQALKQALARFTQDKVFGEMNVFWCSVCSEFDCGNEYFVNDGGETAIVWYHWWHYSKYHQIDVSYSTDHYREEFNRAQEPLRIALTAEVRNRSRYWQTRMRKVYEGKKKNLFSNAHKFASKPRMFLWVQQNDKNYERRVRGQSKRFMVDFAGIFKNSSQQVNGNLSCLQTHH